MFFFTIPRMLRGTLVPQNLQKSTPNPLEIRFSDNVFFERVLNSILLRFSVAPNLKSSVFTKEKQCFLRNWYYQTKRKKCLFSRYFGPPKPIQITTNLLAKTSSKISSDFPEILVIFGSFRAPKHLPKSAAQL